MFLLSTPSDKTGASYEKIFRVTSRVPTSAPTVMRVTSWFRRTICVECEHRTYELAVHDVVTHSSSLPSLHPAWPIEAVAVVSITPN